MQNRGLCHATGIRAETVAYHQKPLPCQLQVIVVHNLSIKRVLHVDSGAMKQLNQIIRGRWMLESTVPWVGACPSEYTLV